MMDSAQLLIVVQRFQQGEKKCFDEIYSELSGPIKNRAVKMGLNVVEGEDITQKVLVRVYLYAEKATFESGPQFWAWVFKITSREIIKHWQSRRPELGLADLADDWPGPTAESGEIDPSISAAATEVNADVHDCISRLSEAARLHLLGPLVEGLTFRDAAKSHKLTLGQYKHRYEQALHQVRDCMKSKGHDLM